MIKVKVFGDQIVEGTVFAIDPITYSLVLRDKDNTFTFVNHSHILSIEGKIDLHNLPNISECGPSFNSIEKLEQKASDQFEKNILALNFDVKPEVQTLFDRLNFIFSCEWDGDNIVVLNEFYIAPPYDRVQYVRPNVGGDNSGIERVIKVLEGERKKLKL